MTMPLTAEPLTEILLEDEEPSLVSDELLAELEELDPAEQKLIARLVRRAKRDERGKRLPVTEVAMVHEFLKVDLQNDDFSVLRNITAYTAPPVVKEYLQHQRFALPTELLPLPHPLSQVLAKRASRRDFSKGPMSLTELASLLHYAYGIRSRALAYNVMGFPSRFVPSTGGLQSVEIYFTVNAVEGLPQGLYHYNPNEHSVELLEQGNFRRKVVRLCIFQDWLDAASIVLFLAADMKKVEWKYGRRGYRFVHVDLGIVAQTLHLVATSLKLRSCMIAGYQDEAVHEMLQIDGRTEFIGILMAIGRKSWEANPAAPEAPATGQE